MIPNGFYNDASHYKNVKLSESFQLNPTDFSKIRNYAQTKAKNPGEYVLRTNDCVEFVWDSMKKSILPAYIVESDEFPQNNEDELDLINKIWKDNKSVEPKRLPRIYEDSGALALTSAHKKKSEHFYTNSAGQSYIWNSRGLIIHTAGGDSALVSNFTNGQYGIELTEDDPDKPGGKKSAIPTKTPGIPFINLKTKPKAKPTIELTGLEKIFDDYMNYRTDIISGGNGYLGTTPLKRGFEDSQQRRDPLALDLDGNGFVDHTPAGAKTLFDHIGNGVKTSTGWISNTDGFLVRDVNNNGQIDNGKNENPVETSIYYVSLNNH